jgi:hypothetical protein
MERRKAPAELSCNISPKASAVSAFLELEVVENAMIDRVIRSHHTGWPLYLTMSPNKRTLMNFPMQSGGAEMLRLAAVRLCAAGIVPVMLFGSATEDWASEMSDARLRDRSPA